MSSLQLLPHRQDFIFSDSGDMRQIREAYTSVAENILSLRLELPLLVCELALQEHEDELVSVRQAEGVAIQPEAFAKRYVCLSLKQGAAILLASARLLEMQIERFGSLLHARETATAATGDFRKQVIDFVILAGRQFDCIAQRGILTHRVVSFCARKAYVIIFHQAWRHRAHGGNRRMKRM